MPEPIKSLEALKKHIEADLYKYSGITPSATPCHTMIGVKPPISFYWRPNNFWFTAPYDKVSFIPTLPPTLPPQFKRDSVQLKISNYGTKHSCKNFNGSGISIAADKQSITAMYSLKSAVSPTRLERAWYHIEAGSREEMNEWLDKKKEEIKNKCIEQINAFVKLYGGRAYTERGDFKRQENEIHGEDYIDKLPKDMIIHDTYFKKVYPHGIEMKSIADVKQYISNRVVEDLAPEIAKEINKVGQDLNKIAQIEEKGAILLDKLSNSQAFAVNVQQAYAVQIKRHLKVQDRTLSALDQQTEVQKGTLEAMKGIKRNLGVQRKTFKALDEQSRTLKAIRRSLKPKKTWWKRLWKRLKF